MTPPMPASTCAELARRFDPDLYFCALLAPEKHREALFALYAFNAEIARIRETVSEPMLGMIRLQWWREAIAGIYGGIPPRHVVIEGLAAAIEARDLPHEAFDRLLDGRESDLDDGPMANIADLEAYAGATSSTLTGLALSVLGASGGAAQEAGRHVGIAWALCGLLRAIPFHARARRLYLPADVMAKEDVTVDDVVGGKARAVRTVVSRVAAVAEDHLRLARALRGALPRETLPALLPATLADGDLKRLRRCGFDVFDPRIAHSGVGRKLRVLSSAAIGRF